MNRPYNSVGCVLLYAEIIKAHPQKEIRENAAQTCKQLLKAAQAQDSWGRSEEDWSK